MVKTEAQRTAEWRRKSKKSDALLYRLKKNEALKRYRKKLSPEKKKEMYLKSKLRVIKVRANKKIAKSLQVIIHSSVDVNGAYHGPVFKSAQSLGKAIQRAKGGLPNTPRRRSTVILKLALAAGVVSELKKQQAVCSKSTGVSEETKVLVTKFYSRDDISYQTPGVRDTKVVRTSGVKETPQKQYLMMTVKEAFQLFKCENSDVVLGKSKFADLRYYIIFVF